MKSYIASACMRMSGAVTSSSTLLCSDAPKYACCGRGIDLFLFSKSL